MVGSCSQRNQTPLCVFSIADAIDDVVVVVVVVVVLRT